MVLPNRYVFRRRSVPCGSDHECAYLVFRQLSLSPNQLLEDRDNKGQGLAGPSYGLDYDVLVPHEEGNGGCLHGRHLGVTHRTDDI